MKIVKHRNLMGLFFAIFMMLPMIAIGVRCAYITFNKNAKDSYYGETINDYEITDITSFDDLKSGEKYIFTSSNTSTVNTNSKRIYFTSLDIISYSTTQTNINFFLTCDSFSTTYYGNVAYLVAFLNNTSYTICDMNTNSISFYFVMLTETHPNNTFVECWNSFITKQTYNKYSYLDNAFIYSVHEITDNNLGKIDFFTFFANMFLDLNNPKTQTYVNFVNWYFNYMLLVSLAYLLFFVIMWFINYIRQILEKGNSLGHGGF